MKNIKVALNFKPVDSPWGGGSQFTGQLVEHLVSRGHRVTYSLDRDITHILIIKSWPSGDIQFDVPDIIKFKKMNPRVKCIHRINECDQRKETDHADELLKRANEAADFTVFISNWIKDYFVARWFDPKKPHRVIQNGADPKIFYPTEKINPMLDGFRMVTHHWSSHWMKGFKVYQEVDRLIASGEIKGFSLSVIGRWPEKIRWRSATTYQPAKGQELAELLRKHHIYLTASLWEPCGMHHIEGAQCGLPLIYHEDGGGIVEFGKNYGISFRDNIKQAMLRAKDEYPKLKKKVMEYIPSGEKMCRHYEEILL